MTIPAIGSVVYFQPTIFTGDPPPPALNAEVMHVNSPTSVDLEITAGNGRKYLQGNVRLLQVGDTGLPGGFFARVPS